MMTGREFWLATRTVRHIPDPAHTQGNWTVCGRDVPMEFATKDRRDARYIVGLDNPDLRMALPVCRRCRSMLVKMLIDTTS